MTKPSPPAANGVTTPEIAFASTDLGARLAAWQVDGSASARDIADFILRNSVRVTALGITELAQHCAVSAATVSRFARALGYPNYSAMRSAVAESLQAALHPIDKLRNSIERRPHSTSAALQSLEYASANLDATRQGLAQGDIDQLVERLARARCVYVMGFGLSAHLAGMLTLHLQPFCGHVVEVVGFGGTEAAAGRLLGMGADDMLIAIAFPRYAHDAARLMEVARASGACLVALTDSLAAPVAKLADITLLAKASHPVLPSSNTAAIALIESVVASLLVANGANVDKATSLTAAMSPYLLD